MLSAARLSPAVTNGHDLGVGVGGAVADRLFVRSNLCFQGLQV